MALNDLDDVRVFARVAETGSFTRAAAALGLPKSTVSRRVGNLERALGAHLLQRTTRRLSLTDVGAAYLEHAERALAELEDAARAVADVAQTPRGTLRVTLPTDFAVRTLSALFAEFSALYPEVVVELDVTNRQLDFVADRIDVALRAGTLSDSALKARRIALANFALFASPAYLERAGRPSRPADLVTHACLTFGLRPDQRRFTLARDGESVTIPVRGPLRCNDFGFLFHAARSGMGIAQLPVFGCVEDLHDGGLERVLPDYDSGTGGLYAVYPGRAQLTAKARAFIDFMAARLPGAM